MSRFARHDFSTSAPHSHVVAMEQFNSLLNHSFLVRLSAFCLLGRTPHGKPRKATEGYGQFVFFLSARLIGRSDQPRPRCDGLLRLVTPLLRVDDQNLSVKPCLLRCYGSRGVHTPPPPLHAALPSPRPHVSKCHQMSPNVSICHQMSPTFFSFHHQQEYDTPGKN